MKALERIISVSGPDELVIVATRVRRRIWWGEPEVVGRVTLDPGVGLHIVDVTTPDAPCIVASPRHPQFKTGVAL
jgi:hypothetical protein